MSSDSLYSPFSITIAVPPATSTGSAARNPTAACRGLEPRSRAAAFHRREMASRVVRVAQVSRWPAPNRCVRSATSCFSASSRSRGSICRQFRWYRAKTSAAGIGRWGSRFHVMLRSPLKSRRSDGLWGSNDHVEDVFLPRARFQPECGARWQLRGSKCAGDARRRIRSQPACVAQGR